MKTNYDMTFIGAGPSSIFAVLKLLDNGYKGNICIIEKGNSLENRKPNEVINGFAGAGCFSDSKLTSALDVGGVIPNLTQDHLNTYDDYILNKLNEFKKLTSNPTTLVWDITNDYDTSPTQLEWNRHKTCHVGTENGQAIYGEIEKFLKHQPQVQLLFKYNVIDVTEDNYGNYNIVIENEGSNFTITSKKVILATGQKNNLPAQLIQKFNLNSTPRAFQLGVRVVDQMNDAYTDIIKANYDFKFVKTYTYDNVVVRVRTFCCNSGNAHVCAEKAVEGFTCFNGHAYKTKDETNKTVNYGIICEVTGLDEYDSKSNQIDLMKRINSINTWEQDNFNDINQEPVPKKKLLEGFDHLVNYYPTEVIESLKSFVNDLNQLVSLEKACYLYPEVKLSGYTPKLNFKTFETEKANLYMIGDCALSRGIIKSSITGIIFADGQEV